MPKIDEKIKKEIIRSTDDKNRGKDIDPELWEFEPTPGNIVKISKKIVYEDGLVIFHSDNYVFHAR